MARRPKPDSSTLESPVSPADLARLEALYTFRDRDTVTGWLDRYPFLVPLLLDAQPHLRKYFPDEPIFLQVEFDPEEAELTHLGAYIATDLDESIERLDRFGVDWWLDVIAQTNLKLNFSIEPR